MNRRTHESPRPTAAELEILHVLWKRGSGTVRDVHDALYREQGSGYTNALKLLQVMHAKGLVIRDDAQRAHVYRAALSKGRAQRRFLNDLVARVFEGSRAELVLQALGGQRASREEISAIRALLDRLDEESQP